MRKICRDLNLNRITVKRYLVEYLEAKKRSETSGNLESLHSTISEAPSYQQTLPRVKKKLTEAVRALIDGYLADNERKVQEGLPKQRMLKKDIHAAVRLLSHDVGYTTVCGYINERTLYAKEAYIRQEYQPGSVCEFDWAEVKLVIEGVQKKVYMALFTSAYSNYRYGAVYHRQDQLAFMEAHREFFEHTGGVFQEMVYDNMRVAVAQFVGRSEKRPTKTLLSLAGWYQYRWRFCNVRKGNEKGHVERTVDVVRRKAFAENECFDSIYGAAARLKQACEALNGQPIHSGGPTAIQKLEQERQGLYHHPGMIECFISEEYRVDKYATISFGTNRYSVPDHLVGKFVSVKVYSEELRIYYGGEHLTSHGRLYTRFQWRITMSHYLSTLSRKPGALSGSVALTQAPEIIHRLYLAYFAGESREFIDLMVYCRDHDITPEALQDATWEVEKLCPQDVRVEKVKAILGNRRSELVPAQQGTGLIESLSMEHLREMTALRNMN